jgi:hypothetical protein
MSPTRGKRREPEREWESGRVGEWERLAALAPVLLTLGLPSEVLKYHFERGTCIYIEKDREKE